MQGLAQHLLPLAQIRLSRGEHDANPVRSNRQNLVAGGVIVGDERQQAFDGGDVELEWIDAQVR